MLTCRLAANKYSGTAGRSRRGDRVYISSSAILISSAYHADIQSAHQRPTTKSRPAAIPRRHDNLRLGQQSPTLLFRHGRSDTKRSFQTRPRPQHLALPQSQNHHVPLVSSKMGFAERRRVPPLGRADGHRSLSASRPGIDNAHSKLLELDLSNKADCVLRAVSSHPTPSPRHLLKPRPTDTSSSKQL